MTRYNTATLSRATVARTPDTTNYAGGDAWAQSPELELASLVTTSIVKDQYYRTADDGLARMRELVSTVDHKFAEQLADYARNTDGLRSITHAVAGEIAHNVKGETWTKNFYPAVVRRPDDVTEILSYYLANYGKPLPNSLKKGLGSALGKFDEYQLAKYRGEGHGLSLVDAVNLVRPRPTAKNRAALEKLVNGTLRSVDTFESKLSAAGSDAEAKTEAWRDLLTTGKIGYMALLKNLRNIDEQAPELVPVAIELLTDEGRVQKSLVLPFRFITALRQVNNPRIRAALSAAVDLSLANLPDLGERVYIAVDGSGSMGNPVAGNPDMTCKYVGSLFAAALYKRNFADVAVFGSDCGPVHGLNPADSTLTIAEKINQTCYGHSTNFPSVFLHAKKPYDTVVIFSDMQAWIRSYYGSNPVAAQADYIKRTKSNPYVFAFDLQGYGTAQFPQKNVAQLSGFSDKSLALMAQLRQDPMALVTEIKKVTF